MLSVEDIIDRYASRKRAVMGVTGRWRRLRARWRSPYRWLLCGVYHWSGVGRRVRRLSRLPPQLRVINAYGDASVFHFHSGPPSFGCCGICNTDTNGTVRRGASRIRRCDGFFTCAPVAVCILYQTHRRQRILHR